jgi:hypothetical protein
VQRRVGREAGRMELDERCGVRGGNLGARMGDGDEVAQGRLKDRNGDQRGGSE